MNSASPHYNTNKRLSFSYQLKNQQYPMENEHCERERFDQCLYQRTVKTIYCRQHNHDSRQLIDPDKNTDTVRSIALFQNRFFLGTVIKILFFCDPLKFVWSLLPYR